MCHLTKCMGLSPQAVHGDIDVGGEHRFTLAFHIDELMGVEGELLQPGPLFLQDGFRR